MPSWLQQWNNSPGTIHDLMHISVDCQQQSHAILYWGTSEITNQCIFPSGGGGGNNSEPPHFFVPGGGGGV